MRAVLPNSDRTIRHTRELTFSELLTSNGTEWVYEPVRFILPEPHRSYTPDFYLPKEQRYVELIGTRQAYFSAAPKLAAFKVCYPDIPLDVVDVNNKPFATRTDKKLARIAQMEERSERARQQRQLKVLKSACISCKVTRQFKARLIKVARQEGLELSDVIRIALTRYLRNFHDESILNYRHV